MATLALVVAAVAVLALTGPTPEVEASSSIRRYGGVCLRLERWGLLGWEIVGHSATVSDIQNGRWSPDGEPACSEVPHRAYLIRNPFDSLEGVYRLCGLADTEPCLVFRKVPFAPTRAVVTVDEP